MWTHNRSEDGRDAWVALCARPIHADTYDYYYEWGYTSGPSQYQATAEADEWLLLQAPKINDIL
jgi:hypothetical protein